MANPRLLLLLSELKAGRNENRCHLPPPFLESKKSKERWRAYGNWYGHGSWKGNFCRLNLTYLEIIGKWRVVSGCVFSPGIVNWTAAFRSNSTILEKKEKKNMAGGADSAQYRRLCYRLAWLPRWCLRRSSWTLLLQAHRERGFCFPISFVVFWESRVCDLKTWNLCMRKFPSETETFQSNGLTWSEFETVVSNEQVWLGTLGYIVWIWSRVFI